MHLYQQYLEQLQLNGYTQAPIEISHCIIERLTLVSEPCPHPIVITACTMDQLVLLGNYFFQGLILRQCTILGDVHLSASGHNQVPCCIEYNNIQGFTDFDDAYFEAPIIIRNNQFVGGTNLIQHLNYPYGLAEQGLLQLENNKGI
jgi:hypothetical protein